MPEPSTDTWQGLMDQAYDKWNNDPDFKDLDYLDFLEKLTERERETVLLGNLNYQVGNGGFSQWIDNGYCRTSRKLTKVLRDMGSAITIELAMKIDNLCLGLLEDSGFTGYYPDDEEEEDEIIREADRMDKWFYEETRHNQFLAEVEAYLSRS